MAEKLFERDALEELIGNLKGAENPEDFVAALDRLLRFTMSGDGLDERVIREIRLSTIAFVGKRNQ